MRKVLNFIWKVITAPFRLVWWIIQAIKNFFKRIGQRIRNLFTEEPEDTRFLGLRDRRPPVI